MEHSTQPRNNHRHRSRQNRRREAAAGAPQQRSLPPLEERVHPSFLRTMRDHDEATAKILGDSYDGLLPAVERLGQLKLHYNSSALCKVAKLSFPKRTSTLCIPQYKKRSIETLLRHMKILERLPTVPQVALLGDSMLERLSRQRLIKSSNQHLFNFSVGGDGVEHLLCRLEICYRTYLAHTPTFVILIGINNAMGASRGNESQSNAASADQIVQGILHIVRFVRRNSRASGPPTIYLCQLLHIWGSDTLDYRVVNPTVDRVNALLEHHTRSPTLFPDRCHLLHTAMPLDPVNYIEDGLHLSKEGYQKLLIQLPDFVQQHQQPF